MHACVLQLRSPRVSHVLHCITLHHAAACALLSRDTDLSRLILELDPRLELTLSPSNDRQCTHGLTHAETDDEAGPDARILTNIHNEQRLPNAPLPPTTPSKH